MTYSRNSPFTNDATKVDPAKHAYDWEILVKTENEWNVTALGRTDSLKKVRKNIIAEFGALSPDVQAKANISLMGPIPDLGDRACLWFSPDEERARSRPAETRTKRFAL